MSNEGVGTCPVCKKYTTMHMGGLIHKGERYFTCKNCHENIRMFHDGCVQKELNRISEGLSLIDFYKKYGG